MKMTVRKIAEAAQVSPAAVSLVLNDKPGVRPELRAKITALLVANGYTIKKNETAAAKPRRILYLYYKDSSWIPYMRNDFLTRVLDGIETACRQNNCSLSVANVNYETLESALNNARMMAYDGVVFLGTEYKHTDYMLFENFPLPFVSIDRSFSGYSINSVTIDNDLGNYQALSHLKQLNHTRIGYITSKQSYGAYRDREKSFYHMMQKLELEINEDYIYKLDFFQQDLQKNFLALSASRPALPTAFVTANDVMAVSAVFSLTQKGCRVPDDISVIGFDDSSVCLMTSPHLTSTRADWERLGALTIERLMQMIAGTTKEIHKIQLGTTLQLRGTTAAVSDLNNIPSKKRQA